MKAIQTLWCGGRSLLRSPFWWRDAEYNLMSWALSCHSLREQFGGVTLYTDSEGARVLVDALGLPYTEVVVNYDGFDCLTCHWALAKVRTYSLQTGPFVHIDGDIYMPRPLPAGLRSAGLLAQNVEVYTDYNRSMVRKLLAVEGLRLAPRFREVLEGGDVPSLNLGFCGGTDLGFFGRFCGEVFRFFSDNDFNGERFRHDDISANVVFEQIFFAIMARDEGREVAAVYPGSVGDNRYTAADFCDLLHYPAHGFFHVLGGHKRTRDVCDSVARALLWRHPATFARVAALFPGSLPGGAARGRRGHRLPELRRRWARRVRDSPQPPCGDRHRHPHGLRPVHPRRRPPQDPAHHARPQHPLPARRAARAVRHPRPLAAAVLRRGCRRLCRAALRGQEGGGPRGGRRGHRAHGASLRSPGGGGAKRNVCVLRRDYPQSFERACGRGLACAREMPAVEASCTYPGGFSPR